MKLTATNFLLASGKLSQLIRSESYSCERIRFVHKISTRPCASMKLLIYVLAGDKAILGATNSGGERVPRAFKNAIVVWR